MTREIIADFAIYANTTTANWGSILGNIEQQTDLINLLNLKVDKSTTINGYSLSSNITLKISDFQNDRDYLTRLQVNSLISVHNTSETAHTDIRGLISDINNTMSTYGNIVTHNVSEFATAAQGSLADSALQPSDVVNNVVSTAINLPLSANMGKSLQDEIDTLKARGRFLSLWNCATGLPETEPLENPYEYKAGDYYIVGTVGTTNYQPTGSEYIIGTPSTVLETQAVSVDDVYYYDGANWKLQLNTQKTITFAQIAGQPTDNSNLASALNDKVTKNNAITAGTATKITYDIKGLVTAGTTLSADDIPSLTLSKISDVTATATELNYVDGVTSAIQTQLDGKEPKVNVTSKGTATLPVYFDSNGVAQTITSYEGNSATATKATQDGSGNVITDTYVNNDRLNAIPAYENYGYTQTESKGLADLKSFNRSTFDKSKFNDTSTTTITDDGIASGFSSSNRLHFVVDLSNAEKYTIEGCFTYKNTGAEQIILFNGSFYRWFITSDGNIQWRCPNNGNNYWIVVGTVNASNAGITDGTKVWLKTEYIGSTTRKMYYSLNGTDYTLVDTATTNNRNTFSLNAIYIGSSYIGGEPFAGTFNLKSLAVTVDDVEVFNGNKNGIDVIKADNFTKTGSPTVSTDGIASGFLASNYLSGSVSISANSSYSVKGSFKTGTLSASEFIFSLAKGTTNVLALYINYTNDVYKLSFIYPYGGFVFGTSLNLTDNTTYNYEVAVIGANIKLYVDGTQVGNFDTFPNTAVDTVVFGVGSNGTSYPFSGSIDLNDFQIISGDTLIYQPLLRIPYNHTKTGLKIVHSSHRNRVQDMYNQFGWANYFTLSDTDFTVPMGENLDGHVTKVDWYKNGITTWEYDTNLDCIETGSCTSGTAVTLPKPMADDTYSLSVPYSAKSKTGFTPSASGDYIAEGKVVLG